MMGLAGLGRTRMEFACGFWARPRVAEAAQLAAKRRAEGLRERGGRGEGGKRRSEQRQQLRRS